MGAEILTFNPKDGYPAGVPPRGERGATIQQRLARYPLTGIPLALRRRPDSRMVIPGSLGSVDPTTRIAQEMYKDSAGAAHELLAAQGYHPDPTYRHAKVYRHRTNGHSVQLRSNDYTDEHGEWTHYSPADRGNAEGFQGTGLHALGHRLGSSVESVEGLIDLVINGLPISDVVTEWESSHPGAYDQCVARMKNNKSIKSPSSVCRYLVKTGTGSTRSS